MSFEIIWTKGKTAKLIAHALDTAIRTNQFSVYSGSSVETIQSQTVHVQSERDEQMLWSLYLNWTMWQIGNPGTSDTTGFNGSTFF